MARVSFFSAIGDRPLVKQFTDQGVKSYPRVKRVSSHTHDDVNTPEAFEALLREHANQGHCLLKGQPDTPLMEESRRGRVNRDTPTGFMVLDFDGVEADEKLGTIYEAAEYLIEKLPEHFHNVSYIAQASASFGRNRDKISLHLFFILTDHVHPRALREYITTLNFDGGFFEEQLCLSATGTALSFSIDRTIADNARIIYIAPPSFAGLQTDPFTNPEERIVRVDKRRLTLSLDDEILTTSVERTETAMRNKIKSLRKLQGLNVRRERTKILQIDDSPVTVVVNPDRVRMSVAEDEGSFVRYNVNGGDSNAYWVHKSNPSVVYNFKGEPNFLFEAADPDTFAWHCSQFSLNEIVTEEGHRPLIFLDYSTAKYFYGLYDPKGDRMDSIYACGSADLKHFVAQHGALMPENIPVWQYEFIPENPTVIDFEKQFLNRYEAPDHLRYPAEIPEEFQGLGLGYGVKLSELCPTIWKLLDSVCGNGVTELEYFINWLAYILQTKQKAMTAWVFHGVPGTGKGLLYNNVLAPLLGEPYCAMKRSQDIEEKFNQWMQQCLLFVVDEFRLDNGVRGRQLDMLNKIKNIITEPKGTIRAMGTDQYETKLYANVIFFSNDHDAIKIQDGDRRFNIAPRQETALIQRYPELLRDNNIKTLCQEELPLLAAALLAYKYDELAVILPLENDAKATMREASSDSADMFVDAVVRGDLDYFIPIMDEPFRMSGEDYTLAAKNLLKAIIRDYKKDYTQKIFLSELRPLYNVLCGKAENEHKFGKLLSRHGLRADLMRRGSTVKRGVRIAWQLKHNDIEDLRSNYLTAQDMQYVAQPEEERVAAVH